LKGEKMTIKELREKTKKTQVELAIAFNVSVNTIRAWEMGVTEPSESNQKKIDEYVEKQKE